MPFGSFGVGAGHPGAIASVDSIESVGSTLVTMDASAFNDGDEIYVGNETFAGQGSIKDYVRVRRNAGLTPTEGEVWNSATPNVQFERLHTPSASQLQKTVWTLTWDGSLGTGIIDNDGFGARPISMRELNRRRANDNLGVGSTIVVQVPPFSSADRSELLPCTLQNWWGTDGNAYPILLGQTTRVGATLTVAAFTAENHAANTPNVVQAPGIGTRCTGIVGTVLVRTVADTKKAIVEAVIDADHVQVSQPRSTNIVAADPGSIVAFAAADVVEVITLASLPIWPYVPNAFAFPAASLIDFSGLEAEFNIIMFGDAEPQVFDCLLTDIQVQGGGIASNFSVCGYNNGGAATANTFADGHSVFWSCAFLEQAPTIAGKLDFTRYAFTVSGTMDLVHCRLLNSAGTATAAASGAIGLWAGTVAQGPFFVGDTGAFFSWRKPIFGALNSAGLLPNLNSIASTGVGTYMDLTESAITVLTASDFAMDDGSGLSWPRTSLSLINPFGGGIIDASILRSSGAMTFSGAIVTSAGGATTSFLSNPGSLLAVANQTVAQAYPASRRIIRSMTVTKRASTASVNIVVTLMVGAGTSATAMTVTILAADPVGTQYTDAAHPITLGSPQDIDVRLSAGVDAAPGTAAASVTLQS